MIGDFATAYSKADKIRSFYPASARLAAYWVLTAPPEKSTGDLERELSSILLTDIQVRAALASKALSRQELDAAEAHADVAVKSDPSRGHPEFVLAQVKMAKLVNLEAGRGGSSSVPMMGDNHNS